MSKVSALKQGLSFSLAAEWACARPYLTEWQRGSSACAFVFSGERIFSFLKDTELEMPASAQL